MSKPNKLKRIPKFRDEAAERRFWDKHDTTDYVDLAAGKRVRFPNLKPTLTTISLRLPEFLIRDLKSLAHEKDIPYQSLLKVYLAERLKKEWDERRAA